MTAAASALALAREQLGLIQGGDVEAFLAGNQVCFEACQAALDDPTATEQAAAQIEELAAVTRAISEELAAAMEATTERTQQLAQRRRAASAYLAHPAGEALGTREL
ncbi:MAG: hypothetical protein IT303_09305 [Dehalococcoidia bacterium]|nr:hypothetical protein [Dehalococcoidia bacterium]